METPQPTPVFFFSLKNKNYPKDLHFDVDEGVKTKMKPLISHKLQKVFLVYSANGALPEVCGTLWRS